MTGCRCGRRRVARRRAAPGRTRASVDGFVCGRFSDDGQHEHGDEQRGDHREQRRVAARPLAAAGVARAVGVDRLAIDDRCLGRDVTGLRPRRSYRPSGAIPPGSAAVLQVRYDAGGPASCLRRSTRVDRGQRRRGRACRETARSRPRPDPETARQEVPRRVNPMRGRATSAPSVAGSGGRSHERRSHWHAPSARRATIDAAAFKQQLRRRRRQHRDGHQGQDRRGPARAGRDPLRGPHPLRGPARHRQVDAGPGHRRVDRTPRNTAIQCTPDMLPGDITGSSILDQKRGDVRVPARARLHQHAARRRDQPGDAEDAVGAARGHGRAPGVRRRHHLRPAPAVPRARHPEPGRAGRHVPAARGAARPLPLQALDGLHGPRLRVRGHVRQLGAAVDRGPRRRSSSTDDGARR